MDTYNSANDKHWMLFLNVILMITFPVILFGVNGILHYAVSLPFATPGPFGLSNDRNFLQADVAALIVSFPLFSLAYLAVTRRAKSNPSVHSHNGWLRAHYVIMTFSFIILFLRSFIFVYELVSFTVKIQSALHFLVDFLVAGAILVYGISEIRPHHRK